LVWKRAQACAWVFFLAFDGVPPGGVPEKRSSEKVDSGKNKEREQKQEQKQNAGFSLRLE
jgi:hypothetical protein